MKARPVSRWKSIVSRRVQGKPADYFCLFQKVKPAPYGRGNAPVFLNVYDLTAVNDYLYWSGIGVFHSGVEVYGMEYAFGAHEYPSSGVFEVEPRQCPGFKFRKSILVGTTSLDPMQVRDFIERQSASYHGDTYHLIVKNCNHFCEDMCFKLTGKTIPRWVNRLARIGSMCNCILPEAFKVPSLCHNPNYQGSENEKKRLRSAFSCLPSISGPASFSGEDRRSGGGGGGGGKSSRLSSFRGPWNSDKSDCVACRASLRI